MKRVGFFVGAAFGFLIAAHRLNDYDVIHNMLLLREWDVYLMMGSAILTAAPLLWLLQRRGWQTPFAGPLRPQRSTVTRRNVLGSVVFGTGWAVSGACPGPALALPAAGTVLGVFVIAGMFVGIALHDAVDRFRVKSPVPQTKLSSTAGPNLKFR